jgi:hypothetical protein
MYSRSRRLQTRSLDMRPSSDGTQSSAPAVGQLRTAHTFAADSTVTTVPGARWTSSTENRIRPVPEAPLSCPRHPFPLS